jgi:hypothetical protein
MFLQNVGPPACLHGVTTQETNIKIPINEDIAVPTY